MMEFQPVQTSFQAKSTSKKDEQHFKMSLQQQGFWIIQKKWGLT